MTADKPLTVTARRDPSIPPDKRVTGAGTVGEEVHLAVALATSRPEVGVYVTAGTVWPVRQNTYGQ